MAFLGGIFGGGPDGEDIRGAAHYITDPSRNAYQIEGRPQLIDAMGGYSRYGTAAANAPVGGYDQQQAAANMLKQTALGQGPSLARANMQAGLNNANAAIASQAMTNMGNAGMGVTQRNLLNAQAAAANNVLNQTGVASAQEQLGAQQNFASAAQGLANTSLGARQQQLQAYSQAAQNANSAFAANAAQANANMQYDQNKQQANLNRYNNEIQAVTGDANQGAAVGKTIGNIVGGATTLMGVPSDEACKQDVKQGPTTKEKIGQFLQIASGHGGAPGTAPAAAPAAAPAGYAMPQMLSMNSGMVSIPTVAEPSGIAASGLGGMLGNKAAGGIQQLLAPTVTSDERCKQQAMAASDGQLGDFMDSMEPSTFKYKDQGYSPGTHLGVMAQDVDDTPVGADMVEQGAGGLKQLNVPKALGATLASLAYLNERIDKMEGGRRHVA